MKKMVVMGNAADDALRSLPCMINHHGAQNEKDIESRSGVLIFRCLENNKHCYVVSVYTPSKPEDNRVFHKDSDIDATVYLKIDNKVVLVSARAVISWHSSELACHLGKVFQPEHQWSLSYNDSCKNDDECRKTNIKSLSWFILYQLDCMDLCSKVQNVGVPLCNIGLKHGSVVTTCSFPFGPDLMEIFTETVSSGVIGNLTNDGTVFMTDARCLPGSEGGCVYTKNKCKLIGMIISPLCWKSQELIGLTICCSIESIFKSLLRHLPYVTKPSVRYEVKELTKSVISGHMESTDFLSNLPSIVRVDVAGIWGSGVVVASKQSTNYCQIIIATCGHVIERAIENQHLDVNVIFSRNTERHQTKVLFSSDKNSAYDLALLELRLPRKACDELLPNEAKEMARNSNRTFIVPYSNFHTPGAPVLVIGHALFDVESGLEVTTTSGVLSNVVQYNGLPVLLHSTCLVHKGSSGGGLVCMRTGKLEGIVVNHVLDEEGNISYPDVNFSVPCEIFMPAVEKYMLFGGDPAQFDCLNSFNKGIIRIWHLEPNNLPISSLRSKL